MKELSIEQKSKRYDEVSKEVKDFFEGKQKMYSDVTQTLEHLFPELKESEDERIRKWIIGVLATYEHDKKLRDAAVAWLEKQGEQKPAWNEEDESWFKELELMALSFSNDDSYRKKFFDWLKSLKDRVQPQPKREWSQNDIEMIDWLIRSCKKEHEELCNDKYGHQDIVSDLKRDCRKKWDWLESLKNRVIPKNQWKPSDEQIKVCKEVYADFLSAKGFDLGTVNSEPNRLEEQLKKLKE